MKLVGSHTIVVMNAKTLAKRIIQGYLFVAETSYYLFVVAVHYVVTSQDGTQSLRQSADGGEEFVLSNSPVPAFATALKTMKMHEKVSLIIKPPCKHCLCAVKVCCICCDSAPC